MMAKRVFFTTIAVLLISFSFASPMKNGINNKDTAESSTSQSNRWVSLGSPSSSSLEANEKVSQLSSESIERASLCNTGENGCKAEIELIKPRIEKMHGGNIVAYTKNDQKLRQVEEAHAKHKAVIFDLMEAFVKTADGRICRFPPGNPGDLGYGMSIEKSIVFGGSKGNLIKKIAGFQVNRDASIAVYKFKKQILPPIAVGTDDFKMFRYPDGRHMIPQVNSLTCGFSAMAMMLLDRGLIAAEDALSVSNPGYSTGVFANYIVEMLRVRTNQVPVLMEWSQEEFTRKHLNEICSKLKKSVEDYGPGIVNFKGHFVLLDSIKKVFNECIVEIRDPYHGELSVMKATKASFKKIPNQNNFKFQYIAGIFLPTKPHQSPKKKSFFSSFKNKIRG